MVQQRHSGEVHPGARPRATPPGGSADCPGLPPLTWKGEASSPRAWIGMAGHPGGGRRCGAHRGHWASPSVRSAENLSR